MTSSTAHPVRRPSARSAGAARAAARAVRTAVATVAAVALLATPAVADTGTGSAPAAAPRAFVGHEWKGWDCDGYYRIETPTPGMVLEYDQGPAKAVLQRPSRNSDTQLWEVCRWPGGPLETADFILKAKNGGDCVTLWGGYQQEDYWFSVYNCDNVGQNQKFWISHDPATDTMMFQVLHSGMWMAIQGTFAGDGSHVAQYLNRATAFSIPGYWANNSR
ncbi:RICIN domain-containing protein [Kitasatospora sp. NPDC002543]